MAVQDAATLKSYFNTGDVPTEAQFADLIDTIESKGGGGLDETAHDLLDHSGLPGIPSVSGLLNEAAHDALDHSGLLGIPDAYSLPTASTTVLGGVKIDGTTILISDGVISSTGGAGGGVTDHGLLTGLADDDHPQYHNNTRGDARYSQLGHTHNYAPALGADDNYVTDAEKAGLHSHSNKTALDNVSGINTGDQDLSGYSLTTHNHSLNNLTEKSYNSLTDKPSIPSIAGLLNEAAHDALDHAGLTGVLAIGTTGTTACAGNDSRLSDARTPTAHAIGSHSDWPTDVSMTEVGYLNGLTSAAVGVSDSQTLTNKTITNPTVTNYVETIYAPAAGASFTVDLANGTFQKFTTNANTTITLPSSVAGKSYTIMVAFGGAHTLSWTGGSTIKWSGGTAPTATSVSGKYDIFSFMCDGTNTYGRSGGSNF